MADNPTVGRTLVDYPAGAETYDVPFDYLARRYVQLTLIKLGDRSADLILTHGNDYVFESQTKLLILAPQQGYDIMRVRRITLTDLLVDFKDGSVLTGADLTTSELQAIHIAEEGRDQTVSLLAAETSERIAADLEEAGFRKAADDVLRQSIDGLTATVGSNRESSLRVPESSVEPIPASGTRAGSLLGFDQTGKPIAIFNQTSVGDLAVKLASPIGGELVSTQRGETLQKFIDQVQGGEYDVLDTDGFYSRLKQTGMFKMVETAGSPKGTAAFVFGADGNYGAIVVDERGRLQVYSVVDGYLTASQMCLPFVEGTGFFNGPFEDKIVTFPSSGQEDDSKSPALLFTYDPVTQRVFLSVVSPFRVGEKGYPYEGFNEQYNRLANYYDLGFGLNHSFDHFMTTDINGSQWGTLCTISAGTGGDGARSFSAEITAGNYTTWERATYTLDINGQNLVQVAQQGLLNQGNINQWVRFQRHTDSTNATMVPANIPEVAARLNDDGVTVDVVMRVPPFSPRPSITVLTMGNPTYVKVDWTDWARNILVRTEPAGLIYAKTLYPVTSQNYVTANSGEVLKSPNTTLRVKDLLTANSPYFQRMDQFLEYGFSAVGSQGSVNRSRSGITITKNGTGDYTVSGCTLSSLNWKSRAPYFWDALSGSGPAGLLVITESGSGYFRFTLRRQAYNSIVNSAANPPTVATTATLGAFIDIPDGTWCDFHIV